MSGENFLRVPYAQSVHGQEEIDAVVSVLKLPPNGKKCY